MNEKPKILVVDDEQSHRIMLRAVLSDDGYAVTEAADGTEDISSGKPLSSVL
jgi:CheY-like chemotaxis protein